jgi:hypothetical protein
MSEEMPAGTWTYRSYLNDPALIGDDASKALNMIFGEGTLRFSSSGGRNFKAVLDFGGGAAMDLYGSMIEGAGVSPQVMQITGTGREGTSTAKWVYQYLGYVVPDWAEGVSQVPAIVGSVIRTIPHGSGQAGVVVSFIAIKQT